MYKSSCVPTVSAIVSYEVCLHSDSVIEHFQLRTLNLLKATLHQNPSFMKQYNKSPKECIIIIILYCKGNDCSTLVSKMQWVTAFNVMPVVVGLLAGEAS